ncbi:MAG TPA: hypothetical protein VGJ81_13815 [Thermoanaerobaculia bacterium]|jgi:hypothetical protein
MTFCQASKGVLRAGASFVDAAGLCCLLAALTPAARAETKPVVAGFVSSIHGRWVTAIGSPDWQVSLHSLVYVGQQIQAVPPTGKASITLVLGSGKAMTLRCAGDHPEPEEESPKDPCNAPFNVEIEPTPRSQYQQIIDAVIKLVKPEQPGAATTVARDVFGPQLAVLAEHDEQLDLRPALKRVPDGAYVVQLTREHGEGQTRSPLALSSSGPALVKAGVLPQGLYRLALFSAPANEPVGSAVLVLVAPADQFESLHESFAEARELTSHWDEKVDAASAEYVLETYLRALSGKAAGSR